MATYLEMQNWVLDELNDTSSTMRTKVERYIHTILSPLYLGVRYSWNLNATTLSVASGASTFALPSPLGELACLHNETHDCPLTLKTARQMRMYEGSDGIIELVHRVGGNVVFPQTGSDQSILIEWYPPLASLCSGGALSSVPEHQVIMEGAKWLGLAALGKNSAAQAQQTYLMGLGRLKEAEEDEKDIRFEFPEDLTQEG